ncbi:hypothetical protein C8R43DRAFT_952248 [Mycena crocata]|nr:hypothetical protein C8R43DRAFT_952248 [Mycena crocata]
MSSSNWVTRNKHLTRHAPALEWTGGSHIRFKTAEFLTFGKFPASLCILVDDIAVRGLYSQITRKSAARKHDVLQLSLKPVINGPTTDKIRDLFEARKATLFKPEQTFVELRDGIENMVLEIWSATRKDWRLERPQFDAFRWAFHAYSMLVAPWSPVSLTVSPPGVYCRRGFGIVADRDLFENEYLWELAGMLSSDYTDQHTGLSVVPHPDAKKNTLHILFGPIRLINHDCIPNAEFVHLECGDKLAFTVQTNRAISAGEEILVRYGESYELGSEFGGPCPCRSCRAKLCSSVAAPVANQGQVINEDERREANRLKSMERKAKKKYYKNFPKFKMAPDRSADIPEEAWMISYDEREEGTHDVVEEEPTLIEYTPPLLQKGALGTLGDAERLLSCRGRREALLAQVTGALEQPRASLWGLRTRWQWCKVSPPENPFLRRSPPVLLTQFRKSERRKVRGSKAVELLSGGGSSDPGRAAAGREGSG